MAYCANCGSQVEGRFCPKCGAPVAATPGGDTGGTTPPPPQPAPLAAPGLDHNVACALCYLLGVITGILFLVLEPYKNDKEIRFHAFQSIFLWVAAIAVSIGVSIVVAILGSISFIGFATLGVLLSNIVWLGFFVIWVFAMYKAYKKEHWVIPVIGPLAEKQA
jgi:uncharacterized membrane protein